ncbi:sulfotransferase [Pseudomaricurvus sp. HS19]|nr:sulfotransferase [Pseudomaricurvus sp. HS19]
MIDAQQLLATARQQTGLTDIGDESVLEGLQHLVDALNNEAPLTERGWQSITGVLIRNLSNRLQVENYLQAHPQLLQQPVSKPTFVFGLPRTGTTLTINLLNADPGRRCLLRWEAFNSVPPPKAGELSSDPRCLQEQAMVDMSLKFAPHISAIHHEDADSPTECQFAMSQSFCAQYYEAIAEIPSYRHWLIHEADYLPAFRYHKKLLQVLQSEAPGHWTLKNPWHPLFLDALTEVYPDAQLVMTHRDPVDVVASACSLIKVVRQMFSDKVDLHYIGASMMDMFAEMIRRADAYKEKHGQDSIYDLHYSALMADPLAEMKKLYAHFDEPLTAEAADAMTTMLQQNPKGKHGKHEYSLEEYGLSAAMVRERFGDYCQRYGIATRD